MRIAGEFVLLALLIVTVVVASYLLVSSANRRHEQASSLVDPTWTAVHHTTNDVTVVMIVKLGQVVGEPAQESQTFGQVSCQDPDYDRKIFNMLQDARERAFLLNGLENR